jgi:GNAT superfamily N-acetyltransferase
MTTRTHKPLPEGYTFTVGPPDTASYLRLRKESGLSGVTEEQASAAMKGSTQCVHVSHDITGEIAGMGRFFGDGGWYFIIADMAVLPSHQKKGLGNVILDYLMETIRIQAPAGGAYVSLMADPPGRKLYRNHGFVQTDEELGMWKMVG